MVLRLIRKHAHPWDKRFRATPNRFLFLVNRLGRIVTVNDEEKRLRKEER